MFFKSIQIQKKGVKKSLGDLETRIMQTFWQSEGPITAREVTDRLCESKEISFNAVSTVIKRLELKELIIKRSQRKRYSFVAAVNQEKFAQNIVKSTLSSLLGDTALLNAAGFSGTNVTSSLEKEVIASLEKFITNQKKKND